MSVLLVLAAIAASLWGYFGVVFTFEERPMDINTLAQVHPGENASGSCRIYLAPGTAARPDIALILLHEFGHCLRASYYVTDLERDFHSADGNSIMFPLVLSAAQRVTREDMIAVTAARDWFPYRTQVPMVAQ